MKNFVATIALSLAITPLWADFSSAGQAAYQRGQYGQAAVAFQKAIDEGENLAHNYFNLGNSLYKVQQVGRALVAYEKATEVAPKFVNAHFNLANVYYELGAVGKALISYHRVAELDPTNASIHKSLGDCYLDLRQYSKAAEHYEAGRDLEPSNSGWDLSLVDLYYKMGDIAATEKPLRSAVKKAPERLELQVHLGDILVQLGKSTQAIEVYQSVLTEDARNTDALYRLASVYEQSESYFLAISTLKQAETSNGHEEVAFEIGRLYQQIGDMRNSLEYYKKAAEKGEEKARNNMIQLAHQYLSQGDVPMAVTIFKEVVRIYPGDMEAKDILQELAS